MSKAKELLLECKVKLGIQTDYKLAQALELHRARISAYMSGKERPDVYTCLRMALILKRDPAELIAEIEAETEKNPKRKAFFADFLQRAKQAAQLGTLAAICILALLGGTTKTIDGFSERRRYA